MYTVTIGILVADARQREAKEYIINYLNIFDENSGKYIDFFIPGYYTDSSRENTDDKKRKYHPNSEYKNTNGYNEKPTIVLHRTGINYYFDSMLFEQFLSYMSQTMKIEYTYNPMLILAEIDFINDRAEIAYQKRLVFELDSNSMGGERRAGKFFDEIFKIAKKNSSLYDFGKGIRVYYIKGKVVGKTIEAISGKWGVVLKSIAEEVWKCRITKIQYGNNSIKRGYQCVKTSIET